MDIVASVTQQLFNVAGAVIASGIITTMLTQLLKWDAIAIPAEKYPVQAAVIISLLVSAGAIYTLNLVQLTGIIGYVVFAGASLLVATQTYDIVRKAIQNAQTMQ